MKACRMGKAGCAGAKNESLEWSVRGISQARFRAGQWCASIIQQQLCTATVSLKASLLSVAPPTHGSGRRLESSGRRRTARLCGSRPSAQPCLQLRPPAQQAQRSHPELYRCHVSRHHHTGEQPGVVLQPRLGQGAGAFAGGGHKRVDGAAQGQVHGSVGRREMGAEGASSAGSCDAQRLEV